MTDAVRVCVKEKFFNFKGRASREEYWLFYAALCFLSIFFFIAVTILVGVMFMSPSDFGDSQLTVFTTISFAINILSAVIALALFFPTLGVTVRRLHDTNKSGWLLLLSFTLIATPLIAYWLIRDSDKEPNKYGVSPK